jgi:hypothetical protein
MGRGGRIGEGLTSDDDYFSAGRDREEGNTEGMGRGQVHLGVEGWSEGRQ